jgi:hypothetical protein
MTIATPEPELDGVLAELLSGVRSALADRFVGMYLHGSLALGDFDRHSDVDFVVAIDRAVEDEQLAALQDLHARIHSLESPWARHLEGSYLTIAALRRCRAENPTHLFLGHGDNELVVSDHDNTVLHRYVLRRHGIALAGPDAATLIDPISPEELRSEISRLMDPWMGVFLAEPARLDNAWRQPYTVLTLCRMLYTLRHAAVVSKRRAAEWAMEALDDRWAGLIERAWRERPDPAMKARQRSTPHAVAATLDFIRYGLALAASRGLGGLPVGVPPQPRSNRGLPPFEVGSPSS